MQLDTYFRHLPHSPTLHYYAYRRLLGWEQAWRRRLQLSLVFSQAGRQVRVEVCGRDATGHAFNASCLGIDGFAAIDKLYRQVEPQGSLLSSHPALSDQPSLLGGYRPVPYGH